jgi:peptidyl-prolyl cis-trans isomerase SurA
MRMSWHISRSGSRTTCVGLLAAVLLIVAGQVVLSQEAAEHIEMLDRVVAVVNTQVILASDLELEMRVFRLLPIGQREDFTEAKALERLTTRALIEQQILQEDPHGLEIAPKELADSLSELKQNLPGCKRTDCLSDAGWRDYLATLSLTPDRVSEYWQSRIAVLRFIELRFRSGIRIMPEDIQTYYNDVLVPKYPSRAEAPSLDRISQRIQEILLQQKVNVLLNDWLKSLQDQGQVEILDPALKAEVGNGLGAEAPGGKQSDQMNAPLHGIKPDRAQIGGWLAR